MYAEAPKVVDLAKKWWLRVGPTLAAARTVVQRAEVVALIVGSKGSTDKPNLAVVGEAVRLGDRRHGRF